MYPHPYNEYPEDGRFRKVVKNFGNIIKKVGAVGAITGTGICVTSLVLIGSETFSQSEDLGIRTSSSEYETEMHENNMELGAIIFVGGIAVTATGVVIESISNIRRRR